MVMEGQQLPPGYLAADVDKYTRLGAEQLQDGRPGDAREAFEAAYRRAKQHDDGFTERACAFNLGAVYIALKTPDKGLEYLQKAVPPMGQRDGKSNGDLFYNFGHGYALLGKETEAVKYYELALEEYVSERDNARMEADVARQVGEIRTRMDGQQLQAARAFNVAATAHGKLQEYAQRAVCLGEEAAMLIQANKMEEAVAAADDCMILCQHVTEPVLVGKLYNELGLMYTQCQDYYKSATCFEMALPLNRAPSTGDKRREAIILQNLGAVYNTLGDYRRAVPFHEQAAALHVELGSRNSQGQCFLNLAFAHSQLGDNDSAGECYLHALQAAKDTEDKKGQWQALEGLAAVCFNNQQLPRAISYFKMALAMQTASGMNNPTAQERIVGKLTDALQCQLDSVGPKAEDKDASKLPSAVAESQTDCIPNGRPRIDRARKERRQKEVTISRSMSRQSEGNVEDTVDQRPTSSSQPRHRREPPPTRRELVRRRMVEPKQQQSTHGAAPAPAHPASVQHNYRRDVRGCPLLRTDTHDSEKEWQKAMRLKRRGTSSLGVPQRIAREFELLRERFASESNSELEYRERLEPPSTAEADSEGYRRRRAASAAAKKHSDNDLLNILKRLTRKMERGGEEEEEEVTDGEVAVDRPIRPKSAKVRVRDGPEIGDVSGEHATEENEESQLMHQAYLDQLVAGSESGEEEEDEEETGSEEDVEETGSEEEEEEEEEEEDEKNEQGQLAGQDTPPLPTSSPPATLAAAVGTYETPLPAPPTGGEHPQAEQDDNTIPPPANYFRSDTPMLKAGDRGGGDTGAVVKVSVAVPGESEDDPLYHTIRTLRPQQEAEQRAGTSAQEAGPNAQEAGPSHREAGPNGKEPIREWEEESGPPTLPPLRNMSRAEESESSSSETETDTDSESKAQGEEFLNNVRLEHERNREQREKTNVDLPSKKAKQTSKMCVCM